MEDKKMCIIVTFIGSLAFAIIYPLLYPALDYISAISNFISSPGIMSAVTEFGPIIGDNVEGAPRVFKGMAEASSQISGENAYLASLPYGAKMQMHIRFSSVPYAICLIIFFAVSLISLLSYLMPWHRLKYVLQYIAIALAFLPLVAAVLNCAFFFLAAYIEVLSHSLLDIIIMILIFPAVIYRVTVAWVAIFILAIFFVPTGLVFAGPGSTARNIRLNICDY